MNIKLGVFLKLRWYSSSTSKSEQDESVDGCPMNRHTCREEGANALDCADNGASRQVEALEVRWMHNPVLRDGPAAPPERRGAEWKA